MASDANSAADADGPASVPIPLSPVTSMADGGFEEHEPVEGDLRELVMQLKEALDIVKRDNMALKRKCRTINRGHCKNECRLRRDTRSNREQR